MAAPVLKGIRIDRSRQFGDVSWRWRCGAGWGSWWRRTRSMDRPGLFYPADVRGPAGVFDAVALYGAATPGASAHGDQWMVIIAQIAQPGAGRLISHRQIRHRGR